MLAKIAVRALQITWLHFQEGVILKEAWFAFVPSLFEDFDNKDIVIQHIKDTPLSRNTTQQQKSH